MRHSTTFRIVGTAGAEVKPTAYVIPSEQSEPRNLPKWQILSCVGSLSNVVDSSTPLALRSECYKVQRFYGFAYCFYNVSRCPAALIRLAQASQLPPREAFVPCRQALR